jgi:hypothetical protein
VDLSGLNRQIDVVVGDQVTEPLGDAAQFESQRNLLECGRWCSLAATGTGAGGENGSAVSAGKDDG